MWKKLINTLFFSLFFFTPLIMLPQTSEIFEFNKLIFIYLISTTLLCLWMGRMIYARKVFFKKTPFDLSIFIFLIIYLLSTFFSIDPHTSVYGYYGRFNGGLLSIISYFIIFYTFITFIPPDKIIYYLKVSLVSSIIVMLWGLPGRLGHDLSCGVFAGSFDNACWTDQFRPAERMFSTLGQPNWLGAYLAINFCLGIYFFLSSKQRSSLYAYGAYLGLNFICILFTRSRSALIAVFASVILLFLYYWSRSLLNTLFRKKAVLLLLLIFFISMVAFKTGIAQIDRFITLPAFFTNNAMTPDPNTPPQVVYKSDITESLDIRKIVWKGAFELARRYPLLGTGPETFAYAYYFVRPQEHNLTTEWDYLYNKAHNEYLNYLATTGYGGFVIYIFLILMVIFFAFKKILAKNDKKNIFEYSHLLLSLATAYITILITNFFGFSTTTIQLFFYLLPAMMYTAASKVVLVETDKAAAVNKWQKAGLVFVSGIELLLLGCIGLYWYGDTLYKKGDDYSRAGDYQSAAAYLSSALRYHKEHVYQDKLSYVLANLAYVASSQNEKPTADKLISVAQYYNLQSLKESPQNVLYWKTRAKNYYLFYSIEQKEEYLDLGLEALLNAQNLSPTDPKIPYSLALFTALKYDIVNDRIKKDALKKDVLRFAQQTIALKQDYRDGYILEAQLLKKFGDREGARKALEYVLQHLEKEDKEARKMIEEL